MLSLTSFTGEVPRTLSHLLPDNAAQHAVDCDFSEGALTGIQQRLVVGGIDGANAKSLYVHDSAGGNTYTWNREVIALRGPIANDSYNRFYWLDTDGTLYVSRGDVGSGEPTGSNKYKTGVPYPTAPAVVSNIVNTASTYVVHRTVVYTYVNQWGEEGPPSDPVEYDVTEDGSATYTIPRYTNSDGYCPVSTIRIYRAATGSSTSLLYLDEVANPGSGSIVYNDTKLDSALGEVLKTMDYYPPQTGLSNIVALPNGIFAVSKGNQIFFCQQYLPYAWVPDNTLTMISKVVGMCAAEGGMYVTTTTAPYFVSGVTPDAMSESKITAIQAGVSRGSIVNIGQFVIYASNDGLVTARGVNVDMSYSYQLFTRAEWRNLYKTKLSLMRFSAHDGNLLCWFTDGTPGFLIRFEGEGLSFVEMTEPITAAFVYPLGDALYVVNGSSVYEFKGSTLRKGFTWWSKDFTHATPTNYGVVQLRGVGDVTVTVYANGVQIHNAAVTLASGVDLFMRPASGFLAHKWSFKVVGAANSRLDLFTLARSFAEIRNGK